jgi:hypothetical protein
MSALTLLTPLTNTLRKANPKKGHSQLKVWQVLANFSGDINNARASNH